MVCTVAHLVMVALVLQQNFLYNERKTFILEVGAVTMGNLRIAVCDDEPLDLSNTIEMIKGYDKTKTFDIVPFTRACALLNAEDAFDIILLDIEMEAPNGYDVARQIAAAPTPPVIIFVTKSSTYTLKGYGIALRYLQKPLDKAIFEEALDASVQEASAHRLYFTSDDRTVALPLRKILYIEMYGHYAMIHTDFSEYRIRSTLKDIQNKLPQGYFALPHKSVLVNFEHVLSASKNEIQMDNGATIPISRYRYKEFNDAFFRFLER